MADQFAEVFSRLRRGPWADDPNGIPQSRGAGDGQAESSGWLSDNSVSADVIQANAVTAAKIIAGAIETDKLAANAVTAAKIEANTITANEIAANTITANEIAANTITAAEIAADSISTSELQANAVITENILAANVTSAKIELTISAKNFGANSGSAGAPGVFFDTDNDTGMVYTTALGVPTIAFSTAGALRTQITSAGLFQGGDVGPIQDDTYDSGTTAQRWSTVYRVAESAVSDARKKKDIEDAPLGLDFVKSLRPRVFRWKDTPDTQARESAKPGKVDLREIDRLTKSIERARERQLAGEDEATLEAEIATARDRLAEIHEEYEAPLREARGKRRPGRRLHYGLIAQEVKEALDAAGVDSMDAGFWQQSKEGDQSLSYSELLAPVIKAVQDLAAKVEALEADRV